jgi:predicted DNA-binding transcriptional regulator YafY
VGLSHQHGEIRTFALDAFREVEWLRGDKFEYPADYRPEQVTEGAFGLIRGSDVTRVRILFDPKVARYVERVMWHPTQRFKRTAAGLEMTMEVRGTVEVVSWVLGFGDKGRVIEPDSLRLTVEGELRRAIKLGRTSYLSI